MATRLSKLLPGTGPISRVPPHNLEAEESVLGACLLSREAIATAIEVLSPDDFYKPAHGEIMAAILELYGRGEPVDAVTLSEELTRRGTLEGVGGKSYVHTVVQAVPTPGSAAHYARIVEELALLRRLIVASQNISDIAFSMPEDVEEAVDQSEDLIYQVSQRRLSADFVAIRDLLTENMEMVEKLYERGSRITGLPTGFTDLDEITAGLQPSNLIIVAARPAQGKSALAVSIAQNVAVNEQVPCVIFSLEMSKMELVQRLMCSEARVDSNRLRRGSLQDSDWPKLSHALGRLAEAPIFIDDTPNVTIMEMRAKCRRLKSKYGLGLVIVDYLQLMQALKRTDNRVQEVSEISRSLKILARELHVPVIAVSQLSRNVEYRSDKRPLLADLRESGCLTGESRVTMSSGQTIPIAELVGMQPEVMTLDGWHMSFAKATKVWKTGNRPVFKLRTGTGRVIRATGNHPFKVFAGWKRLDALRVGDRVAAPRAYPISSYLSWEPEELVLLAHLIGDGSFVKNRPIRYATSSDFNRDAVLQASAHFGVTGRYSLEGACYQVQLPAPYRLTHGVRNPIARWLDSLGLFGKRSIEKFVPQDIFRLSSAQISLFLQHLWATDGCVWLNPHQRGPRARIYYATNSRLLAEDVQHLLARLGIVSRIKASRKGSYAPVYSVDVYGKVDQLAFCELVGGFGDREAKVRAVSLSLQEIRSNTNADTIPMDVWSLVKEKMKNLQLSHRQMAKARGSSYGGSSHFKFAPSRELLGQYAAILDDRELKEIASSDLYWDTVVSIEPDGIEDVYDMTVPKTHNFIGNGIVLHNSIEQDSDIVMFIYRDEVYNPDTPQKGIAEIHIAKHRNGPIGKLELAFLEHYTKFANLARGG